ncbi:MAG: hypothetical protein NC098_08355 [Lachnoclostridium sp.]|nr:hypothetical protein [Lachnoclostridium sp.]
MKKIILTLIIGLVSAFSVNADRECHYCKGTGKIVKNISVSGYGHSHEVKVRCPKCEVMYLPSTGHNHIHCQYCRGTGRLPDVGGESDYSGGDGGYVEGVPSVLDLDYNVMTMQAQLDVRTQYYGFPITQSEQNLLDQLSPRALKAYSQLRESINNAAIYANEAIKKNWARNMSPQEVLNTFNSFKKQSDSAGNQMSASIQGESPEVINSLARIIEAYCSEVDTSFKTLFQLAQVSQLSNRLNNMR